MITIVVTNTYCHLGKDVSWDFIKQLRERHNYAIKGAFFHPKVQAGEWDGRISLIKRRTFRRGILPEVCDSIIALGENYKLVNLAMRPDGPRYQWDINPEIELRGYQQKTVDALMEYPMGVASIATGGGKTFIAAYTTAKLGLTTIFLVHTKDLLYQAKDAFTYLIPDQDIGQVGDGVLDIQPITVATVQTLARVLGVAYETCESEEGLEVWNDEMDLTEMNKQKLRRFVEECELVWFDECQRAAGTVAYDLTSYFENAYHVKGLSATPYRDAEDEILIQASLGDIVIRYSASDLIQKRHLVQPKIWFVDEFIDGPDVKSYAEAYKMFISENESRNGKIELLANQHRAFRKILILTKYINHGKRLSKMLKGTFLSGKDKIATRQKTVKKFKEGEIDVLVATRQLFGEGIDIPELDMIIDAAAMKSKVANMQMIGRGLRNYPGKEDLLYFTFRDKDHRFFRIASKRRKDAFALEDAFIVKKMKIDLHQERLNFLAEEIGRARQNSMKGGGTRRFFDDPYTEDIIGAFGEVSFADRFGLEMPEVHADGSGDDGVDFHTNIGTIDVKTARKPTYMLVKQDDAHHLADIVVLTKFLEKKKTIKFIGWAKRDDILDWPRKDFGYGIVNYYKSAKDLAPMEDLEEMLTNNEQK